MMPALLIRMSTWPKRAMASAINRSVSARSARLAVKSSVRRPLACAIAPAVASAACSLACTATSAPASASAIAIAAPSPRDAPVTSATLPSRRKRLSVMAAGSVLAIAICLLRQKIFAKRREDIDQNDFVIEHRGAVADAGWEMQDVATRGDALVPIDDKAHAALLDDRDLLVRMRMHCCHNVRRKTKAAHHQPLTPDHLTLDTLADVRGRNRRPIDMLELDDRFCLLHFFSDRPASRPDGVDANSGCTFTTPYCRSASSRLAAIIQRKLIDPPGAATLG